ncbi:MAG: DUF4405 domain-containing protein [Clostridia bacterium]|nr:DUF4405 domain-containing protein [Clostridia bacterium]
MKKKTVKTILDIMMIAALPVLMAYSLVGETLHEIVGTGMLVLFITHHILNCKATAAMFKGKQTPARIVNTALNIILFVVMIALPVSGIVMSKHLYTFLPTEGLSAVARTAHMLLSYWGFALMSLHLGFHADIWLNPLKKKKAAFVTFSVILTLIAVFGAYAFIVNRLYEYMFLQTQFVFFDFDKPLILTFGEHLSMIVLFAWIGYLLKELLKQFSKKNMTANKADG